MDELDRYYKNKDVQALLKALHDPNGIVRHRAQDLIVRLGSIAVPALIQALSNPMESVRWEAAMALGRMRDPQSVEALVKALEDESLDVRWAAAESLTMLDRLAVTPLLRALVEHFSSVQLREGARHIFHILYDKGKLRAEEIKVFKALESVESEVQVPWAAEAALEAQMGLQFVLGKRK